MIVDDNHFSYFKIIFGISISLDNFNHLKITVKQRNYNTQNAEYWKKDLFKI
jgi:hypothetical protein